ncbi:MAG: hypothetical protein GF328_11415 [Candidatus Latescibacteria bacterium]|nr:hypothetical protein [Candidatus Latescibacterota bacterium]
MSSILVGCSLPFVLIAHSATAGMAESRKLLEAPAIVFTQWSNDCDPDEASLLAQLRAAKKRGDEDAVRLVEQQLGDLRERSRNPVLPEHPPESEGSLVRAMDGEEMGERWAQDDIRAVGSEDDEINPSLNGSAGGLLVASYDRSNVEVIGHFQSTDGGESWEFFTALSSSQGTLDDLTTSIGEGNEDWLVSAFVRDQSALGGWRQSLTSNDFSTPGIYENAAGISHPEMTTDAAEYPAWFAYVAFNVYTIEGWAVCVSRSMDYGASWDDPVIVGWYCPGWDASDAQPDIAYGSGALYVVYASPTIPCDDARREVFVTRSFDYGVDWETPVALTTSDDLESEPAVAVIHNDIEESVVLVAYSRFWDEEDYDIWYAYSQNHGAEWQVNRCLSCAVAEDERSPNLATSFSNGVIHTAFWHDATIDYGWADRTSPEDWTFQRHLNHGEDAALDHRRPGLGVNPTLPVDREAGILWVDGRNWAVALNDLYYDGPGTTTGAPGAALADGNTPTAVHPNPFSDEAVVLFDLPRSGQISLTVLDAAGRKVRTLGPEYRGAGRHAVRWDGTDQDGRKLRTSVYFVRLAGEDFVSTTSVTLLR